MAWLVNATRARHVALMLSCIATWQLTACGRSRREIENPGGASGTSEASEGGTSGTSGFAGTSGASGVCPLSVDFDVTFAQDFDATHLCGECGYPSVTLLDSSGNALDRAGPNCEADCATCEVMTCHSILRCNDMPLMGAFRSSWSGESWVSNSCGTSEAACKARVCATSGRYAARFCFARGAVASMPAAEPQCVLDTPEDSICQTVEFELPASSAVSVVLTMPSP